MTQDPINKEALEKVARQYQLKIEYTAEWEVTILGQNIHQAETMIKECFNAAILSTIRDTNSYHYTLC